MTLTFKSGEPISIPISFGRVVEIWKEYDKPHLFRLVLPSGVRSSVRSGESFVLKEGRRIDIFVDGGQKITLSRVPGKCKRLLLDLPPGIRAWKRRRHAEERKPTVFALGV